MKYGQNIEMYKKPSEHANTDFASEHNDKHIMMLMNVSMTEFIKAALTSSVLLEFFLKVWNWQKNTSISFNHSHLKSTMLIKM